MTLFPSTTIIGLRLSPTSRCGWATPHFPTAARAAPATGCIREEGSQAEHLGGDVHGGEDIGRVEAGPESLAYTRDGDVVTGSGDAPTLVTVGELDYLLSVAASEELQRTIPDAELVVVPGGPHLVTMETPERFNEVTSTWLHRVTELTSRGSQPGPS
jgi:pimeloyl-ACP methyl ester carboxylesterase